MRKSVLFATFFSGLSMFTAFAGSGLSCTWSNSMLRVHGERIPGGSVEIHYLEAYCRPGSTDRDWHETVIGHKTELLSASGDGKKLELQCTLTDGVTVKHLITCGEDEVDFWLTAHNPTDKPSLAHWAQPCIRVGRFTGEDKSEDKYAYIRQCFIFLDGQQCFLPAGCWATEARYTPGQVWCPESVPRSDVNPRPLSPNVLDNGLIGCCSADDSMILATAWEPYQELFQGVIRCIHSDFRIGGLNAGETKTIRGKLYIVRNDIDALLKRYRKDFPEHTEAVIPRH